MPPRLFLMTHKKDTVPLPEDLRVFLTVIRKAGFAAAADELGLSPAYVSKRIQILETTLATRLLHRTSRRIALTEDGERVQRWAVRILEDFQQLSDELSDAHASPRGRLHLCSSFGFGRNHVAPAVSLLAQQYPGLEIRLDLFDRVVDIVSEGFDLEIRVGDGTRQAGSGAAWLYSERQRVGGVPDTVGVFRKAEGVCGVFAGAFQGIVDLASLPI
ncbi:LysR substrate binding domain-containing protein [Pseudomonas cedrina]|uniref:LysR substrate binding domain-containing protein n=1 Tax=Pseudomonas cedrina TaxID=651740 RepID=A0ABY0U8Y3_PSECE|nr:LysR substrate binding domain-containing protein [Pseudomonas cedrina]